MFDELTKILGPHTDAFGLDEWFFTADALAMRESVVTREWWPWLQSAFMAEAARRGLVVVSGDALKVAMPGGRPKGCKHEPPCSGDVEHTRRDMADRRQVPA